MSEFGSKKSPEEIIEDPSVFRVGDFVVFNKDNGTMIPNGLGGSLFPAVSELIGKYGEGPFRVVLARENLLELIEAGHPKQSLVIELPDGRKLPTQSSWLKKQMP